MTFFQWFITIFLFVLSPYVWAEPLLIAIIDTGADINHPDIKKYIWQNPGETGFDKKGKQKETNGIDDDKNGFTDDVHGWNFIDKNNKLTDKNGHGTHITGIIANQLKDVGPSEVQFIILKYYDNATSSISALADTIRAIEYANNKNVDIINYSGGGSSKSFQELSAINVSQQKKILFVAAAGNEYSNSDVNPFFPANYPLSNILSVTALDNNKNILPSSNYGIKSVHVAAPGKDIVSAMPNNQKGPMTGTSQATAHATGIAAQLIINQPIFQHAPERVIRHLSEASQYDEQLALRIRSGSYLSQSLVKVRSNNVALHGDEITNYPLSGI
jgi:subtilisin family serine protease